MNIKKCTCRHIIFKLQEPKKEKNLQRNQAKKAPYLLRWKDKKLHWTSSQKPC